MSLFFHSTKLIALTCAVLLVTALVTASISQADAQQQRFIVRINQNTFVPGDTLVVYGRAELTDAVIVRLKDPSGNVVRIETVTTDAVGSYSQQIMNWPDPSRTFPFGRYSVEVFSSRIPTDLAVLTLTFTAEREPTTQQPLIHTLAAKLDSPAQVTTNSAFRIFVQVTFDGALVNVNNPSELLGSSHIHPQNATIGLHDQFERLHEGIYFADVTLEQEGTYIIHAVAFHRGQLAHDSKVITASAASIVTIQEAVNLLNQKLDSTQEALDSTNMVLEETRTGLSEDVRTARGAVEQLQQASGQINSIILPILALIAIVIALQISLFARIRASFK